MAQKKLPLAIVTWKDHTSCDDWTNADEYEHVASLCTISSVGWIREDTDEKIVLVSAVDKESVSYGMIQTIGKKLVEHIKIIRRSDAIRPGNAQVQGRKASQRQQKRPESEQPKAGDSNNAIRETGKQIKA